MKRALLLSAVLTASVLLCSCGKTFSCDVYYYGPMGWTYKYSEDYWGSSAKDAEGYCEDSYNAYYDCQNCS